MTAALLRAAGVAAQQGARRSRTGPWTPANLVLEAWFRDTYASGTWADLSGKGRDRTQADSGKRPTQVARAGQAALSFDGINDVLQGSFGATLSAPLTIYIVAEHVATGARWIYDGITSGERAFLLSTTGPPSVYRIGGAVLAVTSATTAPTGAIHAHAAVLRWARSTPAQPTFSRDTSGRSSSLAAPTMPRRASSLATTLPPDTRASP